MQKKATIKHFLDLAPFLGLLVFVFFIDQLFKHEIRHWGGFYLCNKGISFGIIVPNLVFWLICGMFLLILAGCFFCVYKKEAFLWFFSLGLALLGGGILSNAFDRFIFGCVFDYISLFKGFFPVFNIADISIFIGSGFVLFSFLQKTTQKS
jgi:lipoprotein signal peptidase